MGTGNTSRAYLKLNTLKGVIMTKTEAWNAVEEVLKAHKASKNLTEALEELLKPKKGGGHSSHPPITNDKGEIVEAWCRYHQAYEPIGHMVIDTKTGKSKGYCKASSWLSNKRRKESRELALKAIDAMTDGDLEKAKELKAKADELSKASIDPEAFDIENDWEEYTKAISKS